jgi:hypothetical protein
VIDTPPRNPARSSSPEHGTVDLDLGGHVGIRLVGADARSRARIIAQLGPIEAPLHRAPDIVVRFVDRLEPRPLTYVAMGESGFDDRSFVLLSGAGRVKGRALIPFEDIGGTCEIVCERALPAVPHLVAIVNMTALSNGVLPLHASAFVHDGQGVLVTGWAKGGKTEALLAFMRRGARYVGDEWVYLTPEGEMFGIPEPIRLWRWQLRQLPELAQRTKRSDRFRVSLLDSLATAADRVAPAREGGFAGVALRRAVPVIRRQVNLRVPPHRLFGADRVQARAPIDAVVFASSHDRPEVRMDDVDVGEVGRRMTASLEHERHALLDAYRQFRFAFPNRRSETLEAAPEIERRLAAATLADRPVGWLRHPYPCDIGSLYGPIAGLLKRAAHQPGGR